MRIKYKILIFTAAVILLPMALATFVIALLVEQQNRLEANQRISDTLNTVLSDIDLQANHLQRAMGEFTRNQDVSESLQVLLRDVHKAGSKADTLRAGNRIGMEMRKLTASTQVDEVSFYDSDAHLLAEHHIEGGDSLYSTYARDQAGSPVHWFKSCRPRTDCENEPWRSEAISAWPTANADDLQGSSRIVQSGMLLGLEVSGQTGAGPRRRTKGKARYMIRRLFDVPYALALSERSRMDVAFYTARQAKLIAMWNAKETGGDFVSHLEPDVVRHQKLQLETGYYAGFRPIYSPDGSLIGVITARLSEAGTTAKTREAIGYLIGIAAASILLALPISLLVSNRLVRPVYALIAGVQDFERGDLAARVAPQSRDEIGTLAATYNRMAETIQAAQSELKQLNKRLEAYNLDLERKVQEATKTLMVRNQQMQHDLTLAAEFQSAILPSMPATTFLHCSLRYLPFGGGVSGDVYDISLNQSGDVNVFLGDATGHGVASAIMTMMAQIGLDSMSGDLPTVDIIRRLNELFAHREREMTITGLMMRISRQGMLSVTNAGHPPLIVVPNGKAEAILLKEGGIPLGMFKEEVSPFQEVRYPLQSGDRIFAFTDGLTEWLGSDGSEFGLERLTEFLVAHSEPKLDDTLSNLLLHVQNFAGGKPCGDDLTILGFQYSPI